MLEGSFRPPSSATSLHHYSMPKSGYIDQSSSAINMRRKDHSGPSFTPIHDHSVSSHSMEYESEEHQPSASPSDHTPRYYKSAQQSHSTASLNSLATHPSSNHPSVHQSATETSQLPLVSKAEPRPAQETAPKNSSIGPVRAKKKPAGSACNSCHRLKTRCSGGHPCDRCAAHKVPCQFDRDLIYRSPLASSSQQASARNAHVMNKGDQSGTAKSRSRANGKGNRKSAAPAALPTVSHSPAPSSTIPMTVPQLAPHSPPVAPVVSSVASQNSPLSAPPSKQGTKPVVSSAPAPPEAYVGYDPNSSHPHGLHVRLAALENSVSGLLQVLRAHQPPNSAVMVPNSEPRPPLSPPTPPNLLFSGSSSTFGPERDSIGDHNRLGSPNISCGLGDPLSEGILPPTKLQYLYDVFVELCLPSLPILHGVQIALIRGRSSFLFTVMVAIGARFCCSQSVAHKSSSGGLISNSTGTRVDLSQAMIDEATYARLVALAHRHLSATLLKATHTLEDVRAILFLACWALVSTEDPNGAPNRWVLIGHAGRISRSIGLDRCAAEMRAGTGIWNNPEIHEARREQLDAIKTDEALRAIEIILSSNLRLEPSRNFFPPLHMPSDCELNYSLIKLATGSPSQYDVVSSAQIQAFAELTEIWAAANSFLSVADDRSRTLSSEQLIELGERHNQIMDSWAKRWTWHGSSWAPLLGGNLRTIRLLSESLRITLNLAFTNVLYAIAAVSRPPPPRLQEALAMALERVNGSSTAVIQAHRDSVREGFSLAFAPDLLIDGLVSAAITVLQLASPIGLAPIITKANCKEVARNTYNQSGPPSHAEALPNEERPLTPDSAEDKTDIAMNDSARTHASNSGTPRRISKPSSPRMAPFFSETAGGGNPAIGKKCFMEPPVAAHYIRMATDVLLTSDRSQTRLGTIMSNKIMKLATQAGLMGSQSPSSLNMGSMANNHPTSDAPVTSHERPSFSSTASLTSTRPARLSSNEVLERNSHSSKVASPVVPESEPVLATGADNTSNHTNQASPTEEEGDSISESVYRASQGPSNTENSGIQDPETHEDEPEDEDDEAEGDEDIEDDEEDDEGDQMASDSHPTNAPFEEDPSAKPSDMMEEDH